MAEALMGVSRLVFLSDGCLSYAVRRIDSEENTLFVTQFQEGEEARRLALPGYFELINRCHELMADAERPHCARLSIDRIVASATEG